MRILVTGGAGFIGSHLVDALVARGHEVVIVDSLDPQVHPAPPAYLNPEARFIAGNLLDPCVLDQALEGCEAVFHQAACVGTAQSQYQISRYIEQNTLATGRLLEAIVAKRIPLRRLVVASSMASYGEGAHRCPQCGPQLLPGERQVLTGSWELHCPHCQCQLISERTAEVHPRQPTTIYALTKKEQEELVRVASQTYGFPSIALRYFNVYGPRQSLSNPYTGLVAIFLSRLRNGQSPVIYEDGEQSRDFVSVHDVVAANLLALDSDLPWGAFNVGSGRRRTVRQMAETLSDVTGIRLPPTVTEQYRRGDIRHCYADISAIQEQLGYQPKVDLQAGIREVAEWSSGQQSIFDRFQRATSELLENGLLAERPAASRVSATPTTPLDHPS